MVAKPFSRECFCWCHVCPFVLSLGLEAAVTDAKVDVLTTHDQLAVLCMMFLLRSVFLEGSSVQKPDSAREDTQLRPLTVAPRQITAVYRLLRQPIHVVGPFRDHPAQCLILASNLPNRFWSRHVAHKFALADVNHNGVSAEQHS